MNLEVSCALSLADPKLADVTGIVTKVCGFLQDQGVQDSKFLAEFELAAVEGMNNAIEHGCAAAQEKFLRVECEIRPGAVELRITDPSAFAGWTGEAALPDDPLAEGGRGRFLMEQMTSSIEHRLVDGRHVLVLTKALAPEAWMYEPGQQEKMLVAMTEELGSSYEMINALIGLGELIAGADELSSFMELALRRLCELTGAVSSYARLVKGPSLALVGCAGAGGAPPPASIEVSSGCVESQVFVSGEEVTITSSATLGLGDPLCGRIDAAFVAPVFFKNQRRGVLVLVQREGSPYFSAAQLKVTRVVAEYLGIVAAMHELQQRRESERRDLRELEIAAEIQLSLMPQVFEQSGRLDIHGTCLPALKAGGDYFDVITLPDGALLVAIADVMGKGISAALLANMLRTNIRAKLELASDPGRLFCEINRSMAPDLVKLDMFITVACAWISPDRSVIREANAGHPAALIFHTDGTHRSLQSHGLPIGVLPDSHYETAQAALEPGNLLLLFTDGIPEASDPAEKLFDVEGLIRSVKSTAPWQAEGLVRHILDDVNRFSDHAPPSDDRTLVAILRKE